MKTGIVGYGTYIPKYRIKTEEIASVWGKDADRVKKGLMVKEKSVPAPDEDAITIGVEAARNAVVHSGIDVKKIGAIYMGSESHPYAVKPSSATVAEAIGTTPNLTAADYEFACKAGTAAIQTSMGLVSSKMVEYAMAIGADTSQGQPGDALEFTAAAGGAAFIIGREDLVAEINDTFSFTTDTPDFWRREGQEFPRHGARFTGTPAYFKHITGATRGLLEKTGESIEEFDHVVFHQPNGKFPNAVAKILGVPKEKLTAGLKVVDFGNTYSGATPLGIAAVLDICKAGDKILATSFGSGAGSDSFSITATDKLLEKRKTQKTTVQKYIDNKKYINYAIYAKYRKKIKAI
ncbi:MAG: hydroxymethylglutaryl-CoA synthase [Candidatus Diapherotrites archaeon]|nr:hydroxymethylglutaryl-CoA synthase [Candidatus Diapherotrites archaeon]